MLYQRVHYVAKMRSYGFFGTYFLIREKATYLNVDGRVSDVRAETGCFLTGFEVDLE
jgi:hypothetical protein